VSRAGASLHAVRNKSVQACPIILPGSDKRWATRGAKSPQLELCSSCRLRAGKGHLQDGPHSAAGSSAAWFRIKPLKNGGCLRMARFALGERSWRRKL
jgi:hypothetical protein